jgi:hypothetical protein
MEMGKFLPKEEMEILLEKAAIYIFKLIKVTL